MGDPVTGYKLRDPILGTETLVSGSLIVDLPGGYNVFSLVLDEFQLPANVPVPPSSGDPWVLTASAVGGRGGKRSRAAASPRIRMSARHKLDRSQRGNNNFRDRST